MQTIDLCPGTTIEHAAAMLVEHAPARADFNGVPICARYATTKPSDVVAHYHALCSLRTIAYQHSPEGKRLAEARERGRRQAYAKIASLLAALPDFGDIAAVLAWVEAAAGPADHVGVAFDREALRTAFSAGGWDVGVNCGDDFNGSDARNYAGWIVGQWLHIFHEGLTLRFIGEWRERFGRVAP